MTPVAEAGAPTVGVNQPCQCWNGKRLPPLRIHLATARRLHAGCVAAGVPLPAILLDYRCPTCKRVVPLTLAKLLAVGVDTP